MVNASPHSKTSNLWSGLSGSFGLLTNRGRAAIDPDSKSDVDNGDNEAVEVSEGWAVAAVSLLKFTTANVG